MLLVSHRVKEFGWPVGSAALAVLSLPVWHQSGWRDDFPSPSAQGTQKGINPSACAIVSVQNLRRRILVTR